jgi:hypothetical protein
MRSHLPGKELMRRLYCEENIRPEDFGGKYGVSNAEYYKRLGKFKIITRKKLIENFDYYRKRLSRGEMRYNLKWYLKHRKISKTTTSYVLFIRAGRKTARLALKSYLELLARRKRVDLSIGDNLTGKDSKEPVLTICGHNNLNNLYRLFNLDYTENIENFRKRRKKKK